MVARIYSPAKTAMQSGKAKTGYWILQFEPEVAKRIDPLMGYTSSADTKNQVRIEFDSKEAAIAFAEKNGWPYRVIEPKEVKRRKVSYSENFSFNREQPWTH